MNVRLLLLHFKMSRLALVSWALALFVLGALSVFWVPELPAYGPAHLPMPAIGSLVFYLAVTIVEADINIERLAISTAVGYLLVMAVFSYTLIASAASSNQRTALALATVITFAAYLAEVIGSGYEGLKWLASASIFHYYDPSELLQDGTVDLLGIGVLGGIVVGGHLAALAIFARRDLSV